MTGGAYRISRIFTASSGFVSYINIILFFVAISTWWPPLLHSVTLLYTSWRPQISPEHVPMYVNLPVSEPRGYSPVGQGTKALTGTSEKKSRHELEGAPWDRQGEISLTFLIVGTTGNH